ncbi:uncharacterized protein [Lolium perenne]|uniref:uncharacterized protein isoform X2 n=1 Tax=Lolium perenne TaxID=4522 RepID=UPI0021F67DAD|nr:uncharacterized protein LOC127321802 isoform X2 [Lolium perenne]
MTSPSTPPPYSSQSPTSWSSSAPSLSSPRSKHVATNPTFASSRIGSRSGVVRYGKFSGCPSASFNRRRILDGYLTLHGVNYILKFPDPEPVELKESTAEETLKEDAMRWRFEQYLMTEHGCNYRTKERVKAWLFDMFKKCALEVEKRNAEGGWASFGTDLFWAETELEFRRRREVEDN